MEKLKRLAKIHSHTRVEILDNIFSKFNLDYVTVQNFIEENTLYEGDDKVIIPSLKTSIETLAKLPLGSLKDEDIMTVEQSIANLSYHKNV